MKERWGGRQCEVARRGKHEKGSTKIENIKLIIRKRCAAAKRKMHHFSVDLPGDGHLLWQNER